MTNYTLTTADPGDLDFLTAGAIVSQLEDEPGVAEVIDDTTSFADSPDCKIIRQDGARAEFSLDINADENDDGDTTYTVTGALWTFHDADEGYVVGEDGTAITSNTDVEEVLTSLRVWAFEGRRPTEDEIVDVLGTLTAHGQGAEVHAEKEAVYSVHPLAAPTNAFCTMFVEAVGYKPYVNELHVQLLVGDEPLPQGGGSGTSRSIDVDHKQAIREDLTALLEVLVEAAAEH